MKTGKRLYQKPVLERVVLIPEENVLGICQTTSDSDQFQSPAPCKLTSLDCQYGTKMLDTRP